MRMPHRIRVGAMLALITTSRVALAQATPGDHWKYVPALPTTCSANDGFAGKLETASTTIGAEIEKQNRINAAAKEAFDKMDMMEKAQRMQAFMMKNPQAAAKMFQTEQAAGAAATSGMTEGNEAVMRLTAELERLQAGFRADLEQAVKPVQAKQEALIRAKTELVGEVQERSFTNAADYAQYVQLIEEENAALAQACAPHFSANGPFHRWLASYRTEVTERMIAAGGDATDVVVMQMAAMDLPGGGYRSTNALQQVANHVSMIGKVYGVRPVRVTPRVPLHRR